MKERGAIVHDIGYRRYLGSRREQSSRWRVIVRNSLAMAWRGWWRLKVWLMASLAATIAFGAVLYVLQNDIIRAVVGREGQLTFADAIIPYSFAPMFFPFIAFAISMTVGANTIARDLKAGAFEFYFSRPVRPIDYLIGKLVGLFVLMFLALGVGPLLLSLFRLGLSSGIDEVLSNLVVVPKALLAGVTGSLVLASAALGFSALTSNPKHTVALWAAYYFVIGTLLTAIGRATDLPLITALDLKSAVTGIGLGLFDVTFKHGKGPGLGISALASAIVTVAFIAIAYRRVATAERAGLGGG